MAYKFLNLKSDVMFVAFHEPPPTNKPNQPGQTMAKVMAKNDEGVWKSYIPNKTAAMLLYLLCRETGDDISYDQFTQLVNEKFSDIPDGKIDEILDWLKLKQVLDESGTTATANPDPLNLFTGPKITWHAPRFDTGKDVDIKGKHAYSPGYYFFTWWR